MQKGDKYIFKDANNFFLRTFKAEQKRRYFSEEGGFESDPVNYCHKVFNEVKLVIITKRDENVLLLVDYVDECYVYEYIISETKKGATVPIKEEHLKKMIHEQNSY